MFWSLFFMVMLLLLWVVLFMMMFVVFMMSLRVIVFLLCFRYNNNLLTDEMMSLLLNCWNIWGHVCNNCRLLLPDLGNYNLFRVDFITFLFLCLWLGNLTLMFKMSMLWLMVVNMFLILHMFFFIVVSINSNHLAQLLSNHLCWCFSLH